LSRNGLLGASAALTGAAVGVGWVGFSTLASGLSASSGHTLGVVHTVLAALTMAGAVGTIVLTRALPRSAASGWPVLLAGCVAAPLRLVLESLVGGQADTPQPANRAVLLGVAGLILVAITVALAATAGARGVLGTLIVAIIGVALFTPFGLAIAGVVSQPRLAWVFALAGLLFGGLAALSPWRAWLAGIALGLLSLLMLALTVGLGRESDQAGLLVPYGLLLAIIVFAATTSVATVGAVLADRGESAPVIGAIAISAGTGVVYALVLTQIGEGARQTRMLTGGQATMTTGVLLLLASGLVIGIASLRSAAAPDDEPDYEPGYETDDEAR